MAIAHEYQKEHRGKMKRRYVAEYNTHEGYNALDKGRRLADTGRDNWTFEPRRAFDEYLSMPKGLTDEEGGGRLELLAQELKNEWMPGYLDVAGWASAEAALTLHSKDTVARIELLDQAIDCWQRAIISQEHINHDPAHEWLREDGDSYRLALNIAFAPLMKALVVGNVTPATIERVFADTMAIPQAASIQRSLAYTAGDTTAACDLLGFGHECNALLTLLYMNDPRHVPLPSSARAGSGYDYPEDTHDIVVINQHWGDILKVVPVEVKSKASQRDLKRYKALIIRGKMHLSLTGKYSPEHTLEAFRQLYEGQPTPLAQQTVHYATSTMRELLQLYQKGDRIPLEDMEVKTHIRFHNRNVVADT